MKNQIDIYDMYIIESDSGSIYQECVSEIIPQYKVVKTEHFEIDYYNNVTTESFTGKFRVKEIWKKTSDINFTRIYPEPEGINLDTLPQSYIQDELSHISAYISRPVFNLKVLQTMLEEVLNYVRESNNDSV